MQMRWRAVSGYKLSMERQDRVFYQMPGLQGKNTRLQNTGTGYKRVEQEELNMELYHAIKDMDIEEMAKAIVKLAADCAECLGACIDDGECTQCTVSRLRDEEEK